MYFGRFPLIRARIGDEQKIVEDFFVRIVPGMDYEKLVSRLVPYTVEGNKTIEQVAFDYYGDVLLHWVVILSNNMTDVYTEWPVNDDVLFKQIYDTYPFTVQFPFNHGIVFGDTLQSSEGYHFICTQVNQDVVELFSADGVAHIAIDVPLFKDSDLSTPIFALAVSDPEESLHHCEDVATGYWVDYDEDLVAQGIIREVSNLENATEENDKKRTIRLLDKKYLGDFVQKFQREMTGS